MTDSLMQCTGNAGVTLHQASWALLGKSKLRWLLGSPCDLVKVVG
jgi:hypothetical protein